MIDSLADKGLSAEAGPLGECSPFLVGFLSSIVSHEAKHSPGICGASGAGVTQAGGAVDECTHLAIALEGAKASCDLAGALKDCVAGAGDPPFEGDCPNIEPPVPIADAAGRLAGMCAELKSQDDTLFKPEGQQEEFRKCACGQAPYDAPSTCNSIQAPPGGCSAMPPFGADYPIPACGACSQ